MNRRGATAGLLATAALVGAPTAIAQDAAARLAERARQDREIVYRLRAPETHAFEIEHDFTETREGTDKYINVVRKGSTVSEPKARLLDTGQDLETEILKAEGIRVAGLDIGEPLRPDSEVVLVRFPAVTRGGSARLRISETYTDPDRYRMDGDELVWDRSLGRPRNAVVLPAGFFLTATSIPATVSVTPDGRIRLDYVNDRPDEIAVLVKARRRTPGR
jgi:hypothetical protein